MSTGLDPRYPLTVGPNERDGFAHIELHAACGCAWHADPPDDPHWHACPVHRIPAELYATVREMLDAYRNAIAWTPS